MLTEEDLLASDGQPMRITTLRNAAGMTIDVMDWGATWLSARVPMYDGSVREAILGCATPADYLRQHVYCGATVGRYANRIAQARLIVEGKPVQLVANQEQHQLHGGPEGFNARRWQYLRQSAHEVVYQLISPAGDQGFPGCLHATASYALAEDNTLTISYRATVDAPCPVNLTNHAYFNLDAQHGDARQHRLHINADRYLPVDSEGIPRSGLKSVAATSFDFRQPKIIAQDFLQDGDQQRMKGYDHAFLLNKNGHPAATLLSADGRLLLTVTTDAPALQLYTGNYLAGTPARQGGLYLDFQGIALESEFLPDSPNHANWPQPNCWLSRGEIYQSVTRYRLTAV